MHLKKNKTKYFSNQNNTVVVKIPTSLFPRCSNCAAVLQAVEEEILRANNLKSDSLRDQERMEQESKQLRQTLMKMASSTSSTMDPEEDQFASQKQSGKKG